MGAERYFMMGKAGGPGGLEVRELRLRDLIH